MAKQLHRLLLFLSLLFFVKQTMPENVIKTTVNRSWQMIKIGAGLLLIATGISSAAIPLGCACGYSCCGCLCCCIGNTKTARTKQCKSYTCITIGCITAAPATITGVILIKSGLKNLEKNNDDKINNQSPHIKGTL